MNCDVIILAQSVTWGDGSYFLRLHASQIERSSSFEAFSLQELCVHFAHISQSFTHTNRNFNIKLFKVSHTSEQGSLLISKLEFFIKADSRVWVFYK